MSRSTISVALCTFDGERFVEQQLESIAAQLRVPDEIVVCDDGSRDATVDIVQRFAARSSVPVVVRLNQTRLGPAGNFGQAIALARGDLVALSDQDDVWLPEKLAKLEERLGASKEAGMVFSDADLVDASLRRTGQTLWQSIGFTRRDQDRVVGGSGFEELMRRNVVAGLTMAFRSHYRDAVLPIPEGALHDLWIASIISCLAPIALVADGLVLYRQHEDNQVGTRPDRWKTQLIQRQMRVRSYGDELLHHRYLLERLSCLCSAEVPIRHIQTLQSKVAHCEVRASLDRRRIARVTPVGREMVCGRYARYSRGARSAAFDLLFRR